MKFVRTIAMWRPVSRPCRRPSSPFWKAPAFEDALHNAVSLGGDNDTLACIIGGTAEAFYGMPPELQQETLKRLPEDLRAAYNLFRQNLERRM